MAQSYWPKKEANSPSVETKSDWISVQKGHIKLNLEMPRHGLSESRLQKGYKFAFLPRSSEYCEQKAHTMSYHYNGPAMAGWRCFHSKGAFSLPASELPFISIPSTFIEPFPTQIISGNISNLMLG